MLERAVILCEGSVLQISPLPGSASSVVSFSSFVPAVPVVLPPPPAPPSSSPSSHPADQLDAVSRAHILSVLHATGWVVAGPTGAAARLGMKRSTLNFRMKKLGIARPFSATPDPVTTAS